MGIPFYCCICGREYLATNWTSSLEPNFKAAYFFMERVCTREHHFRLKWRETLVITHHPWSQDAEDAFVAQQL